MERYIVAFIAGLPETRLENKSIVVKALANSRYYDAAKELNRMTDLEYENYIYVQVFRFS